MAIIEACKEAIWLKGLFDKFSKELKITIGFYNSWSIIFLTKDHMFHEKTKHVDMRYRFVHEVIARGDIVMSKLSPQNNPSDMY